MSQSNNILANSLPPERERYHVLEELRSLFESKNSGPASQKISMRLKNFLSGKEKNLKAFFSWFREEMDLENDWSDEEIKEIILQARPKISSIIWNPAAINSPENHLGEIADSTRSSIIKLFEYTNPSVLENFIQNASSEELKMLKEDIERLFDKSVNKSDVKTLILRENNFDENYLLEAFDKLSSLIEGAEILEKNKDSIRKDLEVGSQKLQKIADQIKIPEISVPPESIGSVKISDEESGRILREAAGEIKESTYSELKLQLAYDAMNELLDKGYRAIFTIPRSDLDDAIKNGKLKVRPTKYMKSISILTGTIGRPFFNPFNEEPRYACVLKKDRHQKYNFTPRNTGDSSFYGIINTTNDIPFYDLDIYDLKTGELVIPEKL